jgi:hypothetical protein
MTFRAAPFKGREWLAMLCLFFAIGAGLVTACGDRKMMTGTEEYHRAHGVVEGGANELLIKGALFRFPPQYFPEPYSASQIVKGQADRATIHLDLSSWFSPPITARSELLALVRIEIRKDGYEDDKKIEKHLTTESWKAIQDRQDLGLREYIRSRDDGGWGYRTYESIVPGLKTPRNGRIVFDCSGLGGHEPSLCRTTYQLPEGPLISYYLSGRLLPRWKDVHAEVVKLVNSLIVK